MVARNISQQMPHFQLSVRVATSTSSGPGRSQVFEEPVGGGVGALLKRRADVDLEVSDRGDLDEFLRLLKQLEGGVGIVAIGEQLLLLGDDEQDRPLADILEVMEGPVLGDRLVGLNVHHAALRETRLKLAPLAG